MNDERKECAQGSAKGNSNKGQSGPRRPRGVRLREEPAGGAPHTPRQTPRGCASAGLLRVQFRLQVHLQLQLAVDAMKKIKSGQTGGGWMEDQCSREVPSEEAT